MSREKVVIVGGGLAGLTAANYLIKSGITPLILEAQPQIGGRVQTDRLDGYLMDRGFQILLPSYPEAKAILDYDKLDLRYFKRGAEIYEGGKMIPFYDPADGVAGLMKTIFSGPAEFLDLFKLLKLRSGLTGKSIQEIYQQQPLSTLQHLQAQGFSDKVINIFWKPFFQGIFLEDDLNSSSRLFEFIFKMFIEDGAAIPASGMGAIPEQLAAVLPEDRIRCNTSVQYIDGTKLILSGGENIEADKIIVACPLNGLIQSQEQVTNWKDVSNFYFTTDRLSRPSSCVMLNANKERTVNNVVHLSEISNQYAPQGKCLVSVSANGEHINKLDPIVSDLKSMYGAEVDNWNLLKSYHIREALPAVDVVASFNPMISEHVYQCGDHLLEGSINAAMKSGRVAAEAVLQSL